ncbi:sulfate transporter-like [Ambystoma mexicanum]|uniref:sulfate transporter-like n=1 Tax=Ambystoma mexicanum TaxID=8296 RepID=UPI0037E7769F
MKSGEEDFSEEYSDSPVPFQWFPYTQVRLEEQEQSKPATKELIAQKVKETCTCTPKTITNFLFKLFPVLEWVPRYKIKEQLLGDIVSGLIVGIVTIPQSIAYALLANLDPIYGLYTNFFCCLTYIPFATSRHNCVGTYGVLCLMIGEVVNKHMLIAGYNTNGMTDSDLFLNSSLAANKTDFCDKSCFAIKVATSLTFLVGVYQILFWIFQLGFIAVYLSEPLLSGFVTGCSLTILTSQMKYLFGVKLPSRNGAGVLVLTWIDLFTYIQNTNLCDLITSIVAFATIIPIKEINDRFKKKMKVPFPVEFVVIVVATLISYYFNFKGKYKSSVCGTIPTGFLPPKAPDVSLIPSLASDALPIAIIGFAMNVSLAEIFGKKHGYPVRANQEMLAIGMCNFIPSFFHAFSCCAALAKTLLRESTGAKTQVTGVVTALVLLLVLLAIAPLFYSLQNCILGVITIASLRGALRKFADTPNMWRISKIDTLIWWISMLSSALISTELGLLVAVCFSLLCVIFRTQRPRATLLAKVNDTEIYEDQFTYKELSDIPNVKIFRFDASLYYANKDYFKSTLYEKTEVNPVLVAACQRKARKAQEAANASTDCGLFSRFNVMKPSSRRQNSKGVAIPKIGMHSLIIDCGAMQFIDTVGLSMLKETHHDFEEIGVEVFLANCNPSVRRSLQEGPYFSQCGAGCDPEQLVFHSVHEAVQFAERKYRKKQREAELISAAFSFNPSQVIAEDRIEQTKF